LILPIEYQIKNYYKIPIVSNLNNEKKMKNKIILMAGLLSTGLAFA